MTRNTRHEAYYDARQDERRRQAEARPRPVSVPNIAYGPVPLERPVTRPTVWAWVPWTDGTMARVAALAEAWNEKAVIVSFYGPGGRVQVTVWRAAVTNRVADIGGMLRLLPLPDGFELIQQGADRIHAPTGAVLDARNVWRQDQWTGYLLESYADTSALRDGNPVGAGAGTDLAQARSDVNRWIAAQSAAPARSAVRT